ncbi:MAG: extracellular solute-binding protein [Eubacteriales bacterium]
MKKWYIKLICGIISIIVMIQVSVLNGCDEQAGNNPNVTSDKISDKMFETVTNVYRTVDIDLPEDLWYLNKIFISGERIYSIAVSKENEFVFVSFDYDGKNIGVNPVPIAAGVTDPYGVNAAGFLSDGSYIIVSNNVIYRLEDDGSILFSKEMVTSDFYAELYITDDDRIYLSNEREITVFDSELNVLYTVENDAALSGFASDSDGSVVIHNFKDPRLPYYYRLDDERQSLEKLNSIKIPSNIDINPQTFFGPGYDTYFSDKNGVYRCNSSDSEATLLLSWTNSDILPSNITIEAVLSEDKILVNINDSFSPNVNTLALLERVSDSEVTPKIPVVLALTETDRNDILREAAVLFNQSNETYRIIFKDYMVFNAAPEYNQAVDMFNKDILQDITPNIVNISRFVPLETYTSKGFFTDLSTYLGSSNLLGCVTNSFKTEGAIYNIPVSMTLITLTGKSEVVGESQSLTLDQLYALADTMPEDASLFSYVDPEDILFTAMYDFVDFKNKTCDFESEQFIRLLNFTANISDYTDFGKGSFTSTNASRLYNLTSESLTGSLADGSLYFLLLPIYNFDAFAVAKYCFGDENFSLKGFPTESGNGSVIIYTYTLGIPEKSRNKQGAWEFMEFLLSDKIQTSKKLNEINLPVTRSAVVKLLEYSHYYLSVIPCSYENKDVAQFEIYIKSIDELPENNPYGFAQYHITLTDSDKSSILNFFDKTEIKSRQNEKVKEIIDEELGAFYAGDVTAGEAAKFIQNRIYTYINE